jgi:hypothetical protein
MMDEESSHRFTLLPWIIAVSITLSIATLGLVVLLAYEVSRLADEVSALVEAETNEMPP